MSQYLYYIRKLLKMALLIKKHTLVFAHDLSQGALGTQVGIYTTQIMLCFKLGSLLRH